MEIKCPECGAENWLENQSRCFRCQAVLRRCIDCASYDRGRKFCRFRQTEVELAEAQRPTALSVSINCDHFQHLGPAKAA